MYVIYRGQVTDGAVILYYSLIVYNVNVIVNQYLISIISRTRIIL